MELNVLNIKGEETGRKVTLDDAIFGIEPNDHAIYLDVKSHMANRRSGTAKTKERSENAHSTRKLFRQKGTGGARRGDTKSPILIGGGTIFGPRPRDYEQKVNRKTKRLARLSALTYKAKDNAIVVIEASTRPMTRCASPVPISLTSPLPSLSPSIPTRYSTLTASSSPRADSRHSQLSSAVRRSNHKSSKRRISWEY